MAANSLVRRALGVFSHRRDAEEALHQLKDASFNMDKVSVLAKSKDVQKHLSETTAAKEAQKPSNSRPELGATAGAATGGLIGLFGSLAVVTLPAAAPAAQLGMVLANTLLGSGIGAAGGGLMSVLINWGVPEEKAKHYHDLVYDRDHYLIMVEGTEQDIDSAAAILKDRDFQDWYVYTPV